MQCMYVSEGSDNRHHEADSSAGTMTLQNKGRLTEQRHNTADNARLGISVRSLLNCCEKTFFEIRITYPTLQSYSGKSLAEIYQQHENEKDTYNQRVIYFEKSLFNPLVFTSRGDGTRRHQIQQKTGWENSWKMQGAICIIHDILKNEVQIY